MTADQLDLSDDLSPEAVKCECCDMTIRGRSALDLYKTTQMCPTCTFGEAAALEEYDD